MTVEEVLSELKERIQKRLPAGITISNLEFEGPELVLYTKEPRKFADNGDIIRTLAKDIRKRITVRPDPEVLAEPDDAIKKIEQIVPAEAKITDYFFDMDKGEVVIEAEKPGLVIGRHGAMLRDITKSIGWSPKVARTPPIESSIIKNIRQYMRAESKARKLLIYMRRRSVRLIRLMRWFLHMPIWTMLVYCPCCTNMVTMVLFI